jgi:hypothetical protein
MAYKAHQTYLHTRGNSYYFRIIVPKKLLPVFGRREYKKSLHTSDYSQARHLCAKYGLFAEGYFRLVDQMKSGNTDILFLIRNFFEKCLMDAEDTIWTMRTEFQEGIEEEGIDDVIQRNKERHKKLLNVARTQEYDSEQVQIAKKLLKWRGMTLRPESDGFRELAKGIAEAQLEAQRMKIATLEKDNTSLDIQHPLLRECKNYLLEPNHDLYKSYRHKPYYEETSAIITLQQAISEYLSSKNRESAGWKENHKRFLNRLIEILGAECVLQKLEKTDGVSRACWQG